MSSLLKRLGVERPIIQAPMAGTSTPAMAAAVSDAGGLGSIGVGAVNAERARRMIDELKALTNKAFNVNVFVHRPATADPAREAAWLEALRPAFERLGRGGAGGADRALGQLPCGRGDASAACRGAARGGQPPLRPAVGRGDRPAEGGGVCLLSTATNLEEAERAAAAGVDAIVAQGYEAGGHRGMFDPQASDSRLSTAALTRLLVSRTRLPVIAAGGVMDGAGIAAMLDLGAEAVQLGTAFIGCPESSADGYHRAALFGPGAAATVMTALISGRPARCLPNAFTALAQGALEGLAAPDYPIAYDAGKALAAAAKTAGEGGFGAQWAGQGAPLARVMPAAELVRTLVDELAAARRG